MRLGLSLRSTLVAAAQGSEFSYENATGAQLKEPQHPFILQGSVAMSACGVFDDDPERRDGDDCEKNCRCRLTNDLALSIVVGCR